MSPRSITTCINTLRDRFLTGRYHTDHSYLFSNSANSARLLVHTCGHMVHSSCLERYREVVKARSTADQPFEGQGVVQLDLSELFCPVCRRVTNDLIPVLPMKTPRVTTDLTNVDDESWLKARLEEFNKPIEDVRFPIFRVF